MKPPPVERSKGGWRRKPRRITPGTIANYWPTRKRVDTLRSLWPSYLPTGEIIERLNRYKAPKPVTLWQCWLMASRLKVRRPTDIRSKVHAVEKAVGKGNGAIRLAKVTSPEVEIRNAKRKRHLIGALVEPEGLLRKVGRKPKPKRPKQPRLWSVGLGMGLRKPVRKRKTSTAKKNRRNAQRRKPARKRVSVSVRSTATI